LSWLSEENQIETYGVRGNWGGSGRRGDQGRGVLEKKARSSIREGMRAWGDGWDGKDEGNDNMFKYLNMWWREFMIGMQVVQGRVLMWMGESILNTELTIHALGGLNMHLLSMD
jgi:hypothetical protein